MPQNGVGIRARRHARKESTHAIRQVLSTASHPGRGARRRLDHRRRGRQRQLHPRRPRPRRGLLGTERRHGHARGQRRLRPRRLAGQDRNRLERLRGRERDRGVQDLRRTGSAGDRPPHSRLQPQSTRVRDQEREVLGRRAQRRSALSPPGRAQADPLRRRWAGVHDRRAGDREVLRRLRFR